MLHLLDCRYVFFGKFDTSGNSTWMGQVGSSFSDQAWGGGVDGQGISYAVGESAGVLTGVGGGALIVSYSAGGVRRWMDQRGGTVASGNKANAVATTASGDVFVVGTAGGGDFDGNALAGGIDMVVLKYASDGRRR